MKFAYLVLALVVVTGFVGCQKQEEAAPAPETTTAAEQPAAEQPAAEQPAVVEGQPAAEGAATPAAQ